MHIGDLLIVAPVLPFSQRGPVPRWSRPLAIATAATFCILAVFPAIAGISRNTAAFPKWWGITDVVLAFVLAAMVFVVMVAAHGKMSREADEAT